MKVQNSDLLGRAFAFLQTSNGHCCVGMIMAVVLTRNEAFVYCLGLTDFVSGQNLSPCNVFDGGICHATINHRSDGRFDLSITDFRKGIIGLETDLDFTPLVDLIQK